MRYNTYIVLMLNKSLSKALITCQLCNLQREFDTYLHTMFIFTSWNKLLQHNTKPKNKFASIANFLKFIGLCRSGMRLVQRRSGGDPAPASLQSNVEYLGDVGYDFIIGVFGTWNLGYEILILLLMFVNTLYARSAIYTSSTLFFVLGWDFIKKMLVTYRGVRL